MTLDSKVSRVPYYRMAAATVLVAAVFCTVGLVRSGTNAATPAPAKAVIPIHSVQPSIVPATPFIDLTNTTLKHRAEQIISSFENSTTTVQYSAAQNIGDGRGITAGEAGFTSGTHDLLLVVQEYTDLKPDNPLVNYLPALNKVDGTDSTAGLENFAADWTQAVNTDPILTKAQDIIYDQLYFTPAMKHAKQLGIKTAVGQLVMLDTIIQHGDGNDPDGLPAIIKTTQYENGAIQGNEAAWLKAFLENRRKVLLNPRDKATAADWRESVSRIDALESIINSGNVTLQNSISWTVYGDHFSLPALPKTT
jgi:chitosanase